jgi:hypothetical protein
MMRQSSSTRLRRGLGWAFLAAIAAGLVMLVVPSLRPLSWLALLLGWLGPFATLIVHLNVTRELSTEEKAVWRRELWFGWSALLAAWTYLFSRDLGEATRGYRPAAGPGA